MPDLNNVNASAEPQVEDMFAEIDQPAQSQTLNVAAENNSAGRRIFVKRPHRFRISRLTLLLIVGGVLVLCLVAGGIWYWLHQPAPVKSVPTQLNQNLTNVNDNASNVNVPAVNAQPVSELTDSDHDGLTDQQESLYNTNPFKADTDGEGLSDREEIKVYHTDPRNPDTDGDGFSDGAEVKAGFDPTNSSPTAKVVKAGAAQK